MFEPYQPRRLTFLGVESIADFRVKVYSIQFGNGPFDRERFAGAWKLAASALPSPAATAVRPGVGFAILHQGRTGDYFVLCYWDNENELPTRVFVRDSNGWRPASDAESFCVWDLHVMWGERERYIATVLSGRNDGVPSYLAEFMEGFA